MTNFSNIEDQPSLIRSTITTFDDATSDLEDKDLFIDQYLLPKTQFQICFFREHTQNSILFASLDDSQRNTLIKVFNVKEYQEDDFVFKIGETANKFYIVRTGIFKACDTENGNIREYYKGDMLCEQAMLFPFAHKFNLKAIRSSTMWYVNRQIFRRVKLTIITRKRKLSEDYLAAIPIFRQLHTSDLINLADCLETISFQKGDFVYKQQSISNGLYIVQKGVVHMCSMDDLGKQIVLHAVKKGGHFGERSMITCSPRKTSALAATDIVVQFLRVDSFERLKGFCKDIAKAEEINDIFGSGVDTFTMRQL